MSWEEALVCDGCSSVIDGGVRVDIVPAFKASGGRAFTLTRRGVWRELDELDGWESAKRHLCAACAGAKTFFDDQPVPVPATTTSKEGEQ